MPFGTEAAIPVRPDLAVIGTIKTVKNFEKSKKPNSPFYSAELEIEHSSKCPGGRDASYYLTLIPEFCTDDFDQQLQTLANAGKGTPASALYFVYSSNIAKTGGKDKEGNQKPGRGALQVILQADFEKLGEVFAQFKVATPPSIEQLNQVFQKLLTGRNVGYVLRQRKEDDGETLMDSYEVSYFFPATSAGIEGIKTSAGSKRRKSPLVLTWEQQGAGA